MANQMQELLQMVLDRPQLSESELPQLDLYVDQITTLLEGCFGETRRNSKEKLLTKTMINNYSKEGLLKQIKGKKYSKQHILMMIMIYQLKQTLSIADIKEVFSQADAAISTQEGGYRAEEIISVYNAYTNMQEFQKPLLTQLITEGETAFDLDMADGEDRMLAVLYLAAAANALTATAHRLIDAYKEPDQK